MQQNLRRLLWKKSTVQRQIASITSKACALQASFLSAKTQNALAVSSARADRLRQNFADVEAGEDVFDKDLESLVQCAAGECAFNNNGLCANAQIDVKDTAFATKCKTYLKK